MLTRLAVGREWLPAASLRYLAKSLGGLLVGLGLLTLWVDALGVAPELAVFINWMLLGVVGCLVLDRWVYRETDPARTPREFAARFIGVQASMVSAKAVNYAIYLVLLRNAVPYRLAWVAGAGVSFGLSFFLTRGWFRRRG
jgi:putative flippase GtrA